MSAPSAVNVFSALLDAACIRRGVELWQGYAFGNPNRATPAQNERARAIAENSRTRSPTVSSAGRDSRGATTRRLGRVICGSAARDQSRSATDPRDRDPSGGSDHQPEAPSRSSSSSCALSSSRKTFWLAQNVPMFLPLRRDEETIRAKLVMSAIAL